MLFTPVLGLVLASFTPVVYSQLPLEQAQQTLIGTWSSGSKHVLTGPVSPWILQQRSEFTPLLAGLRQPCQPVVQLSSDYRDFVLFVRSKKLDHTKYPVAESLLMQHRYVL